MGRGVRLPQVCKKLSIGEQTYCGWRNECGGFRFDLAKQMKRREQENGRLKRSQRER